MLDESLFCLIFFPHCHTYITFFNGGKQRGMLCSTMATTLLQQCMTTEDGTHQVYLKQDSKISLCGCIIVS